MRQIIRLLFAESRKKYVKEPLTFTAEQANSTVTLTISGAPTISGLQYRQSKSGDWIPYTIDTVITLSNVGDIVQFQNTEQTLSSSDLDYVYFVMTGLISASGNIQSMLNYIEQCKAYCYYYMFYFCESLTSAPELPATTLASYCYCSMFSYCWGLTTGPSILPATTLADYCYSYMFQNCYNLTTAPELPATTLAESCYHYMFYFCQNLTEAPELPATILVDNCYSYMFYECTSLTSAPVLPATALASYCYSNMFYNCTSLTEAPELSATTLTEGCYQSMFDGCTSLTEAPELPATTLADYCCQCMFRNCESLSLTEVPELLPATTLASYCYSNMFQNCYNLTTAPELPATTLADYCYNYMFYNCISLTTAPELPATTLSYYCYYGMFAACFNLTVAPALPATTLAENCYANMFDGCYNLTEAPELPATTLAASCYSYMFYYCENLTTAPELPATTLASYCYSNMFRDCTQLNYIKVGFITWHANATTNWINGVANAGTFEAPRELPIIFGISNMPVNWNLPNHTYIIITEDQEIKQNYQQTVDYTIRYMLFPETLQPTFTIVQGELPNGLTLDSATGIISGNLTEEFVGNIKIQISAEGCESVIITCTLKFTNQKETSNLTANNSNPNYTVSQRTTNGSYYAWKAMDGNTTTYSKTQYTSGQTDWWQIDFHKAVFLTGLTLNCNNESSYGTYLEASENGTTWTRIDPTKIPDNTTTTREYAFTTPYRYYRLISERSFYYIQFYQVKFRYTE